MNIQDRRKAYNKYLIELGNGKLNDKAIQALNNAFDVTYDDIDNDINDLVKSPVGEPMYIKAIRFRILMEDLRDYRDSSEVKKNRKDILRDIYNDSSESVNEQYIFPI